MYASWTTKANITGDFIFMFIIWHIDGLVQERRNALNVSLSCTNPLMCDIFLWYTYVRNFSASMSASMVYTTLKRCGSWRIHCSPNPLRLFVVWAIVSEHRYVFATVVSVYEYCNSMPLFSWTQWPHNWSQIWGKTYFSESLAILYYILCR